jgi:hypothetical protein
MKQFKNWKDAGKPQQGTLLESKRNAHSIYKKMVNANKRKYKNQLSNDLQANLLSATNTKFWKCWNGYFKSNKNSENNSNFSIDGFKKDIDIANTLANNFKTACTPNSENKHKKFQDLYLSSKATYVSTKTIVSLTLK